MFIKNLLFNIAKITQPLFIILEENMQLFSLHDCIRIKICKISVEPIWDRFFN